MCTIDIGIRHDNDFIISELADIKIFVNSVPKAVIIALISAFA